MKTAPYGSWKSPIMPEQIASATIRFGPMQYDGDSLYWTEGRPAEGGRQVIVRRQAGVGENRDVNNAPFNVRTLVQEYGGSAYVVHHGTVFFANFDDQRVYELERGQAPKPLTKPGAYRFADLTVDEKRGRLICVCEDHTHKDREAATTIVAIPMGSHAQGAAASLWSQDNFNGFDFETLVAGCDFYSTPRVSPDGSKLSWLCWNHPNMPWDSSEVWVADITAEGDLQNHRNVAGGPGESIFQPNWSHEGVLHFVSDRTNWWNIYAEVAPGEVVALAPMEAEFGMPLWVFGMSTYVCLPESRILCSYNENGIWRLALISSDLSTGTHILESIPSPYTDFFYFVSDGKKVATLAGSPTEATAVVELDLRTKKFTTIKKSCESVPDKGYISAPQTIEFPTENGKTAFAFFYPPTNADYKAPEGELPPLLLKSHGGPTGATNSVLSLGLQYWTSRGFAVVDVNYGGSTGFGREYRDRLRGQWGVVDVDDSVNAAKYLIEKKLVDPNKLAITGGSAGGYTTLCVLTFRDLFKAGASHFGIGDVESLMAETHKFESRYGDYLIGPLSEKELYKQRSPLNYVDQLSCPVIFFQGLEDKAVPPSQAEAMVAALKTKGVPVAYIAYPGEQHGFRKAENIKRTLEAEFYFYGRIFGFEPADNIEPVPIDNLPDKVAAK